MTAIERATLGVLAGGAGVLYYAVSGVRAQWLGVADWRGRTDNSSIALTFDDGPSDDTERVLDALDRFGVRAAFFMIGRQVERHPAIARRVVAAGHEVGNHSYSHPIYLYRGARETYRQLARTQNIIADTTGVLPILSRPPYGVRTPAYFAAARRLSLRTVQWTVAGFDWKKKQTAARISACVVDRLAPGSIVLLHDGDSAGKAGRRETVAALPGIITGAGDRGLDVASLAQLLALPMDRRLPIMGTIVDD
jgi:peptidoglycan/xylan/chitin deacetylase (PgdA/CDA1 family)